MQEPNEDHVMNPHSKDVEAERLAATRFTIDNSIDRIFRLVAPMEELESEPIKLLEVNRETPMQGIVPILFGPEPQAGLHYSCMVVEIHPDEYEDLQSGRLTLPRDWKIGKEFARP